MLGTADLIDKLILQVLHMPASDAEHSPRRERCHQLAQEIVDEWCHQDFSWMKAVAIMPALAADLGVNTLPENFAELGPEGSVMQVGYETPLVERPRTEIDYARAVGHPQGILTRFVLGTIDEGPLRLLTDPPSVDVDLVISYKRTPIVLTDEDPGGLTVIPVADHFAVVYQGVKWRLLDEEGDMERASKAEAKYEEGRARAIKVDRRNKTTVTQLPRNAAGRGMY